ncbi:hypothetical protein J2D69_06910 [Lysinibacillus sphaericus]|uniref:Uncharacterized protein n=3 Tax=Lysinibacillus TaxID=400634 RepID=B1HTB9_LYSSC|nr:MULTISPECIES: hypothetical protein [Lysinibacillus]MBE5083780.1 hypothetical protein [Bacillus thuringiensis]ACA39535.1 hypothetical protein Bsph_1946 [Lysinibacillus sphaericus C3-41]AMO34301.1 hypothetical protein AR327_18645 [Lysinibacillus sphaericus]AMR90587.1 hypothetical protein A1T07_10565 [Lysinibacillus sphaericus]ANA44637.1 hypothetical protein A2J09_03235 [Lysinibacillus sphaericus]
MKWLDLYIESLEEFKEKTEGFYLDMDTFVLLLGFNVGLGLKPNQEVNRIVDFKTHIENILSETKIKESFLIKSLVYATTEILEHNLTNHGDAISLHLSSLDNPTIKEISEKKIEELTSPKYLLELRLSLDIWKQIVSVKFSSSNQRSLERDEMLKKSEKYKDFIEDLTEEEMNMTFKELVQRDS